MNAEKLSGTLFFFRSKNIHIYISDIKKKTNGIIEFADWKDT